MLLKKHLTNKLQHVKVNVRQDLYRVSMFIRYLGGSVSETTVQQWLSEQFMIATESSLS